MSKLSNKVIGLAILLLIAGVVGFVAYDQELLPFQAKDNNGGNGNGNGNGDGDGTNGNGDGNGGDGTNWKAPTSLTAMVSPNPVTMGNPIYGTVVSDGYNFSPLTAYAKHKGADETTTMMGTIGPDGKWELVTQLNTPGYWEFWAEAAGVSSNKVSLTCEGVLVVIELEHWSKTLGPDSTIIHVYSNYRGNCGIYASMNGWMTETYITNTVVNAGGYGEVSANFDALANGNWEFDARIGGYSAVAYGGTDWVQVGR